MEAKENYWLAECEDCGWQGKSTDLVKRKHGPENLLCCPQCTSSGVVESEDPNHIVMMLQKPRKHWEKQLEKLKKSHDKFIRQQASLEGLKFSQLEAYDYVRFEDSWVAAVVGFEKWIEKHYPQENENQG